MRVSEKHSPVSAGSSNTACPPVNEPDRRPASNSEQSGKKTRRKFLLEVGAGAAVLSAAHPLAAVDSAPKRVKPLSGQVRIGVVGGCFGAAFQWHLHPNCKVTAVCDL